MANKKISDLGAAGSFALTDRLEIENLLGTASRFVTGTQILNAFQFGVVNVKRDYNAVGDGVADDTTAIQNAIDDCFGTTASPHGSTATSNKALYFPAGSYKITAALTFPRVRGGFIFGAGRLAVTITQATSGQAVFVTNGFEYSRIESLQLVGNGARVIDLNWDNGAGPNLQSNTFFDLYIKNGTIGVDIGRGGFMGSENIFLACFFEAQSTAGLRTSNFNALQNQVLGGNFQNCAIGIYVQSGSVPMVANCGFQGSTSWDIKQDNATHDTMTVIGCRTESTNFMAHLNNAVQTVLIGVSQLSSTNGTFMQSDAGSHVTIIGCDSQAGQLVGTDPRFDIYNSRFDRSATFNLGFFSVDDYTAITKSRIAGSEVRRRELYLDSIAGSGNITKNWEEDVVVSVTSAKTLVVTQSGFCFNNTGASARVDITLPAAAAQITYTFVVTDTDGLRIIANSGDTIRMAASVSASAGRIDSVTIGDTVTLIGQSNSSWVAVASMGAGWTVT